jgi:hypothetical protein
MLRRKIAEDPFKERLFSLRVAVQAAISPQRFRLVSWRL